MMAAPAGMLAQAEQAAKPAVTVAVLGHQGAGKSTLTAAITRVLSDSGDARIASYHELSTATRTRVEYETAKARYTHVDCAADDCGAMLTSPDTRLDGAVLVVSVVDGPMPQTLEQVRLAHKAGVQSLVVFLNKMDLVDSAELVDLVELDVREMLTRNGFKGDEVPVIRGSAWMALSGKRPDIGKNTILALLAAMDAALVK
jgi:elongation factor Tu